MNNQTSARKARLGRLVACLAVVCLGVVAVYGSNLAVAQNAKKGKKADASKKNDAPKAKAASEAKVALQAKVDHLALAKTIDQLIEKELKRNEVDASPLCSDEEFIRRVYLDLVGVIPTAEAVTSFLDSKDANKRGKLVDELLNDPRYGTFFGELWAKKLLNNESVNRRLAEGPMLGWFKERLNGNMPWDKMVYEFVTAAGPQTDNGAVTFFIANNGPEKMTDLVTQRFLGVQLQCAQCHNHPFTDYKQEEYWGMAAFFTNVTISGNPNQAAKNGVSISVAELESGKKGKRLKLPPEAKVVPAKFLKGDQPTIDKGDPYRPVVAKWMTSAENKYFARAAVNNLWYHLIGRGIVNPVDDMHEDNPASHPELLAAMTDQLKQNNFDLKYVIRAITASQTYQRSSKPTGNNGDDHELFSHGFVRTMHPEQMFDSLVQALGGDLSATVDNPRKKAPVPRNQPIGAREKFVTFFTGDDGYKPLEFQAGIPQALMLMNSKQLGNTNKAINQAMKQAKTPEGVIEHLYLSTLSRRPTAAEMQRMTKYAQNGTPQAAYSDILWALLNSSEFALNH